MRKLREFKCPYEHVTEQLVNDDVIESPCRVCEKPANRIISVSRVSLDPISGAFPGATMKWAKDREQKMKIEQKAIENHGPEGAWDVARR